ncbi:MAG: sigma-54-dependent Fis family transcriptional regulator [Desulfobacteraceae bacterium]|nr:sigma-54-dependent Fis family transcriptional regulator [Desulfobacteraceae bacterium]
MQSHQQRLFSLLIVDDEVEILTSLRRVFRKSPYNIYTAQSGESGLEVLHNNHIDAALVDLKMARMDGLTFLENVRKQWPAIKVVILTGYGGVEEAVKAIQLGAVDFLQKPFENESIYTRINQLYKIWALEQENQRLKERVQFQFGYDQLIGNSTSMLNLKKLILQVAQADASILIQGETGTGKELVACALHYHSKRSEKAFIPVDCGGISETVIGSELFGHVKGAFTGAHESTQGLIRTADKGTLFLDEVGELSLPMQVKLLRSIQEKEVRPVGANRNYPVDVRFLAATNRNLEEEVEQGRFRQDLYYRLNVVVLNVAPLRDRREDIPLLVRYFLKQFKSAGCSVNNISRHALACLYEYDWPGNVRELENVIRRTIAIGQNEEIMPDDLPETINRIKPPPEVIASDLGTDSMAAYELAAIRNALVKCEGHRKKAAQLLGIGEATLYRKLSKYQLGL